MAIDIDETANYASIELILDDLLGKYTYQKHRSDLTRLAQRWLDEVELTNGDLRVALANAYEGYELATGTYIWPEKS